MWNYSIPFQEIAMKSLFCLCFVISAPIAALVVSNRWIHTRFKHCNELNALSKESSMKISDLLEEYQTSRKSDANAVDKDRLEYLEIIYRSYMSLEEIDVDLRLFEGELSTLQSKDRTTNDSIDDIQKQIEKVLVFQREFLICRDEIEGSLEKLLLSTEEEWRASTVEEIDKK